MTIVKVTEEEFRSAVSDIGPDAERLFALYREEFVEPIFFDDYYSVDLGRFQSVEYGFLLSKIGMEV